MSMFHSLILVLGLAALLPLAAHAETAATPPASAERFFEMRTYTANPGKLEALHARFRDHTNAIFAKHGITIVGFWTPTDGDAASNTLVYIISFPSRADRDSAWKAFQEDPEWIKAREESEVNGPLVSKVVSLFLKPTDYSPIK